MMDLAGVRERYAAELPALRQLVEKVRLLASSGLQGAAIPCRTEGRVKDLPRLVRKCLRKGYDYDRVGDKAGVRVIPRYYGDIPRIEEVVASTFEVLKRDAKSERLEFDQLGYLGVHFDVRIPPALLDEGESHLGDLVCEIQIQTAAQNLWADVSHELLYKPPEGVEPPRELKRAIARLVVLVEIFDEEVERAHRLMTSQPGFREGQMLAELESLFYQLAEPTFDTELSLTILRGLQHLYGESLENFPTIIGEFFGRNIEKLQFIYAEYRDDDRHPLLSQPEALLIFERLDADSFSLRRAWAESWPEDLLEDMAAVWGVAV